MDDEHDGLRVVEQYDNGACVCLDSYAGGGAPGGAWSSVRLALYGPDGSFLESMEFRPVSPLNYAAALTAKGD